MDSQLPSVPPPPIIPQTPDPFTPLAPTVKINTPKPNFWQSMPKQAKAGLVTFCLIAISLPIISFSYYQTTRTNSKAAAPVTPPSPPNPTSMPTPTPTGLWVHIDQPNGGEFIIKGQTYRIKWSNNPTIDKVSLMYQENPNSGDWIVTNLPNQNYYDWKVYVDGFTTTQFKIWIIAYQTGFGSVTDTSDNYFSVVNPPTPTPLPTPRPTPTPTPRPTPRPTPTPTPRPTPTPTPKPTPTPVTLTCNSWTDIFINTCNSLTKWSSVPKSPECFTTQGFVTVKNKVSGATQVRYLEVAPAVTCSSVDFSKIAWETYSLGKSWTLSAGTGDKKVCAQFTNSKATAACGAMITVQKDSF